MDSLTLFGHLFKTRCEAICIFLDFFTEKRGSHREIYNFFRKSHEIHCICKRFSIYCNKNCSGNMRILCPFAETTYTPARGRNPKTYQNAHTDLLETTYTPARGRNYLRGRRFQKRILKQLTPPPGDEISLKLPPQYVILKQLTPRQGTKTVSPPPEGLRKMETTYTPSGDENKKSIMNCPLDL